MIFRSKVLARVSTKRCFFFQIILAKTAIKIWHNLDKTVIGHIYKYKEVFVKHIKTPIAPQPRFEGVFTILYMTLFGKSNLFGILTKIEFGQFPVAESGCNCQKAPLLAKTIHLSM